MELAPRYKRPQPRSITSSARLPKRSMPSPYSGLLDKFRRRRHIRRLSSSSLTTSIASSSSSTVTSCPSEMSVLTAVNAQPSIPVVPLNAPSYIPKPHTNNAELGLVPMRETPTRASVPSPFQKHVQSALAKPPKVPETSPSPMLCWVVPAAPMSPPDSEPTTPSEPLVSAIPDTVLAPPHRQPLLLPPIPARNPVNELEGEIRELRKQLEELKKINVKIAALQAAHANGTRHAAGVSLLPVLPTGVPPHGVPSLTSVEAINQLTLKEAHTWVGYYVGRWACIGLELDQARKALRLAVGLCA